MGGVWGQGLAVHAAKAMTGGCLWSLSFRSCKGEFRAGYPREQPRITPWEESRVAGGDQAMIQSSEVSFGLWC